MKPRPNAMIKVSLLWLEKKSATVKGKQRIRQASEIVIDVFYKRIKANEYLEHVHALSK